MEIRTDSDECKNGLIELFSNAFAASEGPDEGKLIGSLVSDLLETTPRDCIRVFFAEEDEAIVGASIFTRLKFEGDKTVVFLLSPMAVDSKHQKSGIGKTLLFHALDHLRSEGVDLAVTYGDPDYYQRVGFRPLSEDQVRPPLPLSMPHGWIGQSLNGKPMPVLNSPCVCVSALNQAELW